MALIGKPFEVVITPHVLDRVTVTGRLTGHPPYSIAALTMVVYSSTPEAARRRVIERAQRAANVPQWLPYVRASWPRSSARAVRELDQGFTDEQLGIVAGWEPSYG